MIFFEGKNPGKFTPGTHSHGGGWKMMFPIELGDFFRFHVDFPGCMVKEHLQCISQITMGIVTMKS